MANAFDSTNFPTKEPDQLVIGDRWMWKRTDVGADYPPSSYSLKYSLRLEGTGTTEIEATASGSGTDFVVEVASATTAGYTAGTYQWQAYVTRTSDSQRITVDQGSFEVIPNRDASTSDPRSHAKKVLDSIETAIEAFVTDVDVKSYTISTGTGSRSVTRADLTELYELRGKYRAEVAAEQRAANGTGAGKMVMRLSR